MTARTRTALIVAGAALVGLWVTYGAVLEGGPEDPGGSCTTGLYPGLYGDSLIPAHLAAYLVIVAAIVWSRPPGRVERVVLPATGVVVLVSLAWPGPIAILGLAGLLLSIPAGVAAIVLVALMAYGRADREQAARALLWIGLLVALPATFLGAYLNGAGLFCF